LDAIVVLEDWRCEEWDASLSLAAAEEAVVVQSLLRASRAEYSIRKKWYVSRAEDEMHFDLN
jgi:hypothetical protein